MNSKLGDLLNLVNQMKMIGWMKMRNNYNAQ